MTRRLVRRLGGLSLIAAALAGLALVLPQAKAGEDGTVTVTARPIASFDTAGRRTRFGALDFIGGLELEAADPDFGGLSALRLSGDGTRFLALSDRSRWFAGTVERDASGRPTGLSGVRKGRLEDGGGKALRRNLDSESLVVTDDAAMVGFEGRARIGVYGLRDGVPMGAAQDRYRTLADQGLNRNGGLEALAMVPEGHPFAGHLLAVSEDSRDAAGNIKAFLLRGGRVETLAVRPHDGFAITDADFLPGGDLVLLERRADFSAGVGIRLRRIAAASIAPGAVLDGEWLLSAGLSEQIDNLEGLSVTQMADGVRLTLVSDDNFRFFQRTLWLEFRLAQ